VIPAAAAIISAIEHALDAFGIRIAETPISPARIVELVSSASSAATAPLSPMDMKAVMARYSKPP
jgi:hypothetical protein